MACKEICRPFFLFIYLQICVLCFGSNRIKRSILKLFLVNVWIINKYSLRLQPLKGEFTVETDGYC